MGSDKEVRDVKILSTVAFLLSTPVLGVGIWLATKPHADLNFLQWPIIAIAVSLCLLSFLGCWMVFKEEKRRDTCCLWRKPDKNLWKWRFYTILISKLLASLLAVTIFAFAVIQDGGGDAVADKAFLEFHLPNYSPWLQGRVSKKSTWGRIQQSLIRSKPCHSLARQYPNLHAFNLANLSPVESGCCKPPTTCGFSFVTSTHWTITNIKNTNFDEFDSDCLVWTNEESKLCFGCNSCKAGVLQNVRVHWRKVSVINIVMFILLTIVHVTGYCMF